LAAPRDSWLVVCDVCSSWVYNYEVKKGVSGNQRGLLVCFRCFDEPHPRDYREQIGGAETRPSWPVSGEERPTWRIRDASDLGVDDWSTIGRTDEDE